MIIKCINLVYMYDSYADMQIGSIYMLTCEIEYVGVNAGKHVCAVLALCS